MQNKYTAVVPLHWLIYPVANNLLKLPKRILILAHDILNYPEDVVKQALINYQTSVDNQGYIIVDNSASEKVAISDTQLFYILNEFGEYFDEFCLPDVLCEGEATVKRSDRFLKAYVAVLRHREKLRFMFIPQGNNIFDFYTCVENMFSKEASNMIGTIGIPRNLCPRLSSSREEFIVNTKELLPPDVEIHLLGFTDNVADDIYCSQIPFVRSIDSAVPLRAHIYGVYLSGNKNTYSEELSCVGPRNDWFENPHISSTVIHNLVQSIKVFS